MQCPEAEYLQKEVKSMVISLFESSIKYRSSLPEVFLGKGALKYAAKFTGEHPCRSVISIKFQNNFIEITLQHGCSSVDLLHIFRTTFY